MPYTVIGVTLVLLAFLIAAFKLPKIEAAAYRPGEKVSDSIWKHPNLLFGALGIFAYVGAEVSIGSFLVNYFGLPNIAADRSYPSPRMTHGVVLVSARLELHAHRFFQALHILLCLRLMTMRAIRMSGGL